MGKRQQSTYQKEYYNRQVAEGRCPSCNQKHTETPQKKYCADCRAKKREYDAARYRLGMAHHQQLKLEVLVHYARRDGLYCVCCGEEEIAFLTLDHVQGGGREHRYSLSGSRAGPHFYRKLKAVGFPNDPPLQVMCLNCNWAKSHGGCPHEVSLDD